MTTPIIRKKRNIKGLGLTASALAPPPPADAEPLPIIGPSLVASRPAPIPGALNLGTGGDTPGSGTIAPAPTPAAGITPGPTPGGKKKRPGALKLGSGTSVGGSGAQQREDTVQNGNGLAPAAQAKPILDESGMLTIPAPSSAPATATLGGVSPFR